MRACVSLSHSLSLAASLCVSLCLSVYLSVSVSLCVTGKRKERERKQLEQQSGATIEQDQKRSWKPIRPQPELKLHSESKSIRIVCMCVCVSVSLCLSGGHETAEKTPMKDKTQKHDHNQNRKKNMISIIEINLKCLRLSRS